ncbi:T9SS type A sorting domain-containing protein [Bacteroidales bacterium OttesenSCG-928-C03]|nr:T9SS type A sorting domain-containing protein [Bacteroidales bacterium OttesenSCG-928-C03]
MLSRWLCRRIPILPASITQNTLLNGSYELSGTVAISNGATVTLTGVIYAAPEAKIIVRPGCKFLVDGGTLTNACDGEMWQGIFVEGNSLLPQTAANQGTVELKNGAVIENAVVGISTGSGTQAGGIIKATNATFRNNKTAVKMLPFTNKNANGNIILNNVSSFTLCSFVIDNDNLLSANGLSFSEHAYLSGVRGVKFLGCGFSKTGNHGSSKGINAHNAGFTVDEYCPTTYSFSNCVCTQSSTRSSFNGFPIAISVNTTGTQHAVTIARSDFSGNNTSIEINGMNNVSITQSDFFVGIYGITLSNATGFKIEGNAFHSLPYNQNGYLPVVYGITVSNSGNGNENSIYRNTFTNMLDGIIVQSVNGSSTLGAPGLQFSCNQFSGCRRGISCVASATIRAMQGAASKGADNDFISTFQYGILSSQQFVYYRNDQEYHTPPNYSSPPMIIANATANTCASTLCGASVVIIPRPLGAPANPSSQYDGLLASYNSLNERLAGMAGNGSLGGERTSEAAVGDAALRSGLEASISEISLQMNEISQREIFAILQDSLLNLAALSEWYDRVPTLSADYSLAETYYHKGDYAAADNALAAIPSKHELDEAQSGEYKNYGRIHALKNTLQQSYRYWDELTETEIEELVSIAEASNERSSTMAKGVLCFFYQICYEDELSGDADMAPKSLLSETPSSDSGNPAIQVFPNPVDDNLTVFIPELPEGGVIFQLFDAVGRGMLAQSITEHHSTINLSALSQGLYYYRVLNDGISMGGGKVVKR